METALGWLGDIIRAMLSFIPCLIVVRATHGGIKFVHGNSVKEVNSSNGLWKTGLHIYWPLVTEMDIVPLRRQTAVLIPQYLTTKDGQVLGVNGIIVYEVRNVVKLLTKCFDYDETIRDYALTAVKSVITEHDFSFFQNHQEETDKKLTETLRLELRRIGIRVIKVTLGDFAKCIVVATWSN